MIGEGEYNLNMLEEIRVTDSYLGLDQKVRGCQNGKEDYQTCLTNQLIEKTREKCECVPLSICLYEQVIYEITTQKTTLLFFK